MSEPLDPGALAAANRRVVEVGAALGVDVRVRRFPHGTRTARDAAVAVGCPLGAIVKSIVLRTAAGPVLVLASGANRVDYDKVAAVLDTGAVDRADPDQVRAATSFAIGGTAPFGHPRPLPTLFDRDLLAHDPLWAAAGTPDTVFCVGARQLLEATGARLADVAA